MFHEGNKNTPIEWQDVDRSTIANDLKQAREMLGISQEDAADYAGISLRTLQRYESAERSIPIETWLKLQAVLVRGYALNSNLSAPETGTKSSVTRSIFRTLARYIGK